MTANYNSEKRKAAADRNHYALLRSAMDVFAENGYHKTTLDEICARANLSKGTIYNHFKDKRDLFTSVVEWGEHQLSHQLRETRKRCTDTREVIERTLLAYFKFFEKRSSFFKVLIQEKYNLRPEIKSSFLNAHRSNIRELEQVIREGIGKGVIRDIDPYTGAVMITGMANVMFFNWLHTDSKKRIIDLYNHAADLIKNGMYN